MSCMQSICTLSVIASSLSLWHTTNSFLRVDHDDTTVHCKWYCDTRQTRSCGFLQVHCIAADSFPVCVTLLAPLLGPRSKQQRPEDRWPGFSCVVFLKFVSTPWVWLRHQRHCGSRRTRFYGLISIIIIYLFSGDTARRIKRDRYRQKHTNTYS